MNEETHYGMCCKIAVYFVDIKMDCVIWVM